MIETKEKEDTDWSDCIYKDRYDSLGVTPVELFYRQNKICYLTIAYDDVEGVREFGDLYCTDGKEYAPTKDMLNPTFECAQCLALFVKGLIEDNDMERKIDTKIVAVLVALHKSRSLNEGVSIIKMSRITFDSFEEHINNTTIFSPETNPIKVSASAEILLFGTPIKLDSTLGEGIIEVEPGGLLIQV